MSGALCFSTSTGNNSFVWHIVHLLDCVWIEVFSTKPPSHNLYKRSRVLFPNARQLLPSSGRGQRMESFSQTIDHSANPPPFASTLHRDDFVDPRIIFWIHFTYSVVAVANSERIAHRDTRRTRVKRRGRRSPAKHRQRHRQAAASPALSARISHRTWVYATMIRWVLYNKSACSKSAQL